MDLARAYSANNGCIAKYKSLINKIQENKKKQMELQNAR